jgi:hypothetical protein
MANPVDDIIELVNQHLAPYDPENGKDTYDLLHALPELFGALSSAAMCLSSHLSEKPGEMTSVSEAMDAIETLMDQAQEQAEGAREVFYRANEFWLGGE